MVEFLSRKLSKKSLFTVLIVIIFMVAIGLIFAARQDMAYMQDGAEATVLPPMPTGINANFEQQVNECLIPLASVYGYNLRISSGFRSVEEQEAIYEQGRTVNGHIVTEAPGGKSIHNYGFAVDLVDRWKGYDIDWNRIEKMANYCGLQSGGEGDVAHFEHRNGLTTDQFRQGMRPPELALPCEIMHTRALAEEKLTLKDLQNCGAPKF